jgi:thymidylate synthase (FAD)
MILVKPSYRILDVPSKPLLSLTEYGKTCYQSERATDPESAARFVEKLIQNGHHSVLEHEKMTVKFIVDRGVTHELVRHRLASYSQESTRYCKYNDHVAFIIPPWLSIQPGTYDEKTIKYLEEKANGLGVCQDFIWLNAMFAAEVSYLLFLEMKWSPQQARSVLPNSLKTEIVMTANLREWRHVFQLRAAGAAGRPHPQMLEVMVPLLKEAKTVIPVLFDDITPLES